jgi:hypothetical protein
MTINHCLNFILIMNIKQQNITFKIQELTAYPAPWVSSFLKQT